MLKYDRWTSFRDQDIKNPKKLNFKQASRLIQDLVTVGFNNPNKMEIRVINTVVNNTNVSDIPIATIAVVDEAPPSPLNTKVPSESELIVTEWLSNGEFA